MTVFSVLYEAIVVPLVAMLESYMNEKESSTGPAISAASDDGVVSTFWAHSAMLLVAAGCKKVERRSYGRGLSDPSEVGGGAPAGGSVSSGSSGVGGVPAGRGPVSSGGFGAIGAPASGSVPSDSSGEGGRAPAGEFVSSKGPTRLSSRARFDALLAVR